MVRRMSESGQEYNANTYNYAPGYQTIQQLLVKSSITLVLIDTDETPKRESLDNIWVPRNAS